MRIVICGCGTTGSHVARILAPIHDVSAIDRDGAAAGAVPGVHAVAGDAADPAVLDAAGARDADALVAVTGDDATNVLIATLAKRHFGVGAVVARAGDPAHDWLFVPEAGVDVVVSAAELVSRLVQEEVTAGDLVTLLRLRGGGVAVTETVLPPGAAAAGHPLAALALPEGVAVSAVVRGGAVLLPARCGRLRAGDVVLALCEPGHEHALHEALIGRAAAAGGGR